MPQLFQVTTKSALNTYNPNASTRNGLYLNSKEAKEFNTQAPPGANSFIDIFQSNLKYNKIKIIDTLLWNLKHFLN